MLVTCPPGEPTGVSTVGGIGGTRARLEDLERCAAELVAAADALEPAARAVVRLTAVVDGSARFSPVTASRAASAVAGLATQPRGVATAQAGLRDLAARLRAAAAGYAAADARSTFLLRRLVVGAHLLGEAGPLAWVPLGAPAGVAGAFLAPRVLAFRALARVPLPIPVVLAARGVTVAAEQRGGAVGWLLGGPAVLPGPLPTDVGDPLVAAAAAFVVGALPGRRPVPHVPGGGPVPAASPGPVGRRPFLPRGPVVGLPLLPRVPVAVPLPGDVRRGALGRPFALPLDPAARRTGAPPTGAGPGLPPPTGDEPALTPSGVGTPTLPVPPVPAAARVLGGALAVVDGVGRGPTELVVGPVVDPRPGPAEAPRSVADLVAGIADVYPSSTVPPGTVAVHRLEDPAGGVSWVVTIPGTQSGTLVGGTGPADMASNLRLMAGAQDDVTELTRQAMGLAGIPAGEPVQLVGHSQGGIAAAVLSGDPEVRARYDVRAVVTAGSPVAHVEVPPDVVTVHLENVQDAVLAADGAPTPDQPHRTVVRTDLSASDDPDLRAAALTWGGPHDVNAYARSAAEAGRSSDPSIVHSYGVVEGLLGGPGTTVTTMLYTGIRVPTGGAAR